MKKALLIVMVVFTVITYGQKKANGTIYVDHPAINLVESMTKAFVSGDVDKVASYLADDFKSFNGTDMNDKGGDKASYLKRVKYWKDNVDYLSIKRSPGAYPDALEYTDDAQKDVVWVQTWEDMKGMHKKTGVKVDMPLHQLFVVNKNNKIKSITSYNNSSIFDEIGSSSDTRKNGMIYNHHDYINKVRLMIHSFENKDFNKSYSFYDKDAKFRSINMSPDEKSLTLDQMKDNDKKLMSQFDITSIDVVGYPDYFNYEMGNAKVVQSWWNFKITRKSDNKKIVMPILFIDTFNDDGMIVDEMAYYSDKLLEK
ncbi:MAG TPA: nuclear transport factor 2 family protein [Flavobacterium sp.]